MKGQSSLQLCGSRATQQSCINLHLHFFWFCILVPSFQGRETLGQGGFHSNVSLISWTTAPFISSSYWGCPHLWISINFSLSYTHAHTTNACVYVTYVNKGISKCKNLEVFVLNVSVEHQGGLRDWSRVSDGESVRKWCQKGNSESGHADLDSYCSDFCKCVRLLGRYLQSSYQSSCPTTGSDVSVYIWITTVDRIKILSHSTSGF